jgi:hypothetical protein
MVGLIVKGGIAPWGMGTVRSEKTVSLLVGSYNQTVEVSMNPYYGPSIQVLVAWGSKWSPCMRRETAVEEKLAAIDATDQLLGKFPAFLFIIDFVKFWHCKFASRCHQKK